MPHARVAAGPVADTFGWDTVYAIRYADVNSAIVKDWPSPPIHLNQTSGPASIDGDFAPWRIATGGSGHLVHMETRVPAMAYNSGGPPVTYDATAEIEVQLEFIPQPVAGVRGARRARGVSSGAWMNLRLKAPTANMAVTLIDVTYAGPAPSDIDKAIIKDLFRLWFNDPANLQNFTTVFASVNLNAKADKDQFQWLMPTFVSYAVAEEGGLPDGIFAVLCMTENRSASGLGHQVSPYAIPAGERSAFLISPERYLRKLLLPGIGLMFTAPDGASKPWPDGYFALQPDGLSIANTASVRIAQLEVAEGQTREATLATGQFTVRMDDTRLVIDFTNLHHDYRHGVLGWLKVDHTIHSTASAALRQGQKFALDPGDGTHTIVVTKNTTAEWVEIGLIGATLLLMTSGLAVGGYRAWNAGAAAETANAFTQTGELVELGTLPEAPAATEAAQGASGCLAAIGGAAVRTKNFLSSMWQSYRATWMAAASTATGGMESMMKMLELIAKEDSQKYLPDFNLFAAGVMTPVQWPNAQSEFDVKAVAFRQSFQVAGDPGFAD